VEKGGTPPTYYSKEGREEGKKGMLKKGSFYLEKKR